MDVRCPLYKDSFGEIWIDIFSIENGGMTFYLEWSFIRTKYGTS